jgi:hypothetical protein
VQRTLLRSATAVIWLTRSGENIFCSAAASRVSPVQRATSGSKAGQSRKSNKMAAQKRLMRASPLVAPQAA